MVAIRKKTRMPPTAPKVPKGPAVKAPKKPFVSHEKPTSHFCEGGPWAGSRISMFKSRPNTAVFSLYGFKGRYITRDAMQTAIWEDM